ncbi:hypothetical protein DSO57_1038263 [Entomophthora muscae]|uniref:Uncharacterized protein n=1 Tax=Entomophthora muscae TaxID=34485 RepID=A0ACC2SBR5_9FUNG|nr:hypothetical protein DSO57_1038263 [Entomophthora muscae]
MPPLLFQDKYNSLPPFSSADSPPTPQPDPLQESVTANESTSAQISGGCTSPSPARLIPGDLQGDPGPTGQTNILCCKASPGLVVGLAGRAWELSVIQPPELPLGGSLPPSPSAWLLRGLPSAPSMAACPLMPAPLIITVHGVCFKRR